MPKLDNIIANRTKGKFKKKEYRPWNLAGDSANSEIREQTDNKADSKADNKEGTTREQLDSKQITQEGGLDNKQIATREQRGDLTEHQTENESGNKKFFIESIKKLAGIQKNIFTYVLDIALTQDRLDTDNILTKELSEIVGASYGSTKTSIKRLVDKGILIRNQGKACRCGHINLGITKTIRSAALEAFKNRISPFSSNITGNNTANNQLYNSSIYNNTTINEERLPQQWLNINYEPIEAIGFSETQLRQLYEKRLNTPEIIQESINHFAFGLEHNEKIKQYPNPLNVLMGVLRKGNAWIESNYESSLDRSIRQLTEFKKQQEEKRKNQMDELFSLYFKPWYDQQTDIFLKTLVPSTMRTSFKRTSQMVISTAQEHYKATEEWQTILNRLKEGV